MNIFRRITGTITASVDRAVSQIENHDALIEANIKESQHGLAQLKVRLARKQKEIHRYEKSLAQLNHDKQKWIERAESLANTDKEKALACLKRSNSLESREDQISELIVAQKALERDISTQLDKMQTRIEQVKMEHQRMRARSMNADIERVAGEITCGKENQLDEIFDRWDTKITQAEMQFADIEPSDSLEAEFIAEEEQAALEAQLADMLNDADQPRGENHE